MIDLKLQQELRAKYNPDNSTLRKLQLCSLEILKEVDALCQRHNIKYYLCSGTLLGAVRHGGFIPWDDDLDIEMSYWDYLKFLRVAKKELPENYKLHTHSTDSNYFPVFAKVRNEKTFISEWSKHDLHFKYRGIFIDILYTEKSLKLFILISRKLQIWLISLSKKEPYRLVKPICTFLYYLYNYFLYNIFRIINIPFLPFCKRHLSMGHCFLKKRKDKNIYPLTKIMFEGYEFNAPKNSDAYLRDIYGDYNEMPDFSKLQIHSINTIIPDSL